MQIAKYASIRFAHIYNINLRPPALQWAMIGPVKTKLAVRTCILIGMYIYIIASKVMNSCIKLIYRSNELEERFCV
jgi:hypothetical protein